MKRINRDKICKALRGEGPRGVYTPHGGRLCRTNDQGVDCFCAMGVVWNECGDGFLPRTKYNYPTTSPILSGDQVAVLNEGQLGGGGQLGDVFTLSEAQLDHVGLTIWESNEIMKMSDKGVSFPQIATWIEYNVPIRG